MTNPMVLPCPFCGGPAGQARWPNHYGCINTECGAYLANLTLEKWNSRADATPEMARVRAIAARIIDARERDHWNDLDEAVDDLLGGSKPPENEPSEQRCEFVGMYDIQCGLKAGHEGKHKIFGPYGLGASRDASSGPPPVDNAHVAEGCEKFNEQ